MNIECIDTSIICQRPAEFSVNRILYYDIQIYMIS